MTTVARLPLVEVRRNRITNPRGLAASDFVAETTGGSATVASVTPAVPLDVLESFQVALRVQVASAVTSYWGARMNVASTASPGVPYTFSAYLRSSNRTSPARLTILFENSTPTTVGTAQSAPVALSNGWVRHTVTAVAPAGTTRISLRIGSETAAAVGDVLFVSGMLLEAASSVGEFFDGETTPRDGVRFAWTGNANNSQSIATAGDPARTMSPLFVINYEARSEARTTIQQAMNSSDVNVTLWPPGLRTGVLELLFDNASDAQKARLEFRTVGARFYLYEDAMHEVGQLGGPSLVTLYDMLFVPAGPMALSWDAQYELWKLTLAYQEVLT